jgi:hypothetical protein
MNIDQIAAKPAALLPVSATLFLCATAIAVMTYAMLRMALRYHRYAMIFRLSSHMVSSGQGWCLGKE